MLHLYCCDISKISDEEFLRMYQQSDRMRREKADRLKHLPSKKLTLAAGMLARVGIAQKLNIRPQDVSFKTQPGGKPYAEGLGIHFSLSHSGNLAVCAICDNPVGIDVERNNKNVNPNVAKRCFTEAEQAYVFSNMAKMSARFFEIWTKKEAYVKLLGTGLKDFLNFDVMRHEEIYSILYGEYTVSIAAKKRTPQ